MRYLMVLVSLLRHIVPGLQRLLGWYTLVFLLISPLPLPHHPYHRSLHPQQVQHSRRFLPLCPTFLSMHCWMLFHPHHYKRLKIMKYTFTDLVMGFDNFYPELVYNAYKFNVVEEGNTVTITFGFYVGNDVKVYQSVAKDNKWVEKDKEILWIDEATVNGVPTGFDILGDVVYVESNSGTWTVGFDETLGHLASSRFYSLSTTDGRFGAIHKGNDKDLIDIGHIDTILVNGYLVSNRDLTDMVVDTNTNALYFIESESGPDIDTFNRSLVIKKTSLDNINGNFEEGEFLDKTSDHVVNIASLGGERIFAIGDPDGVLLKDGEPYPSRGRVLFMYDSDLNELDCVEVPTGDDIIRAELIVTEDEVAVGTFMNMKESRRSAYRE